jgi:hypothetical protein
MIPASVHQRARPGSPLAASRRASHTSAGRQLEHQDAHHQQWVEAQARSHCCAAREHVQLPAHCAQLEGCHRHYQERHDHERGEIEPVAALEEPATTEHGILRRNRGLEVDDPEPDGPPRHGEDHGDNTSGCR